jgi:hypothetical protein
VKILRFAPKKALGNSLRCQKSAPQSSACCLFRSNQAGIAGTDEEIAQDFSTAAIEYDKGCEITKR